MNKEKMDERLKSNAIELLEDAIQIRKMTPGEIIKKYDLDANAAPGTIYAAKCGAMHSCIEQALFYLRYDTESLVNEMAEYYGEA